VQVPTSLLAMIDAAVGGKTGVDVPGGKNLVGAFRQPRQVIIDPALLRTLPDAEYRAGFAEAIKHGAIADEPYLSRIEKESAALLARDPASLIELIRRSIEIKAGFVAADTTEAGPRAALNFGHTIGHALEKITGLALPHGFAVAAGMVLEARLGESLGITATGTAERLGSVLQRMALPDRLPNDTSAQALVEATHADKKARASRVRYTLLERPGVVARAADRGWTHDVESDHVLRVLEASR
jgi:3-dehydroquinate synthase